MEQTIQHIKQGKIIAVLRGDVTEKVIRTAEALAQNGIHLIEVTYTNEDPLRIIAACSERREMVVGAGTVLSLQDAKEAAAAGAKFIVSPCLIPDIVTWGNENNVLVMPGIFTPTEVFHAMSLGANVLKLFPGSTGGIGHMKALLGPFPRLRIVPTGGVDKSNIRDWFAAGVLAVGLGTNLAPKEAIAREEYETIGQLASELSSLVIRI